MKAEHYVIVFFIISIALFTITGVQIQNLSTMTGEKIEYNRSLDNAVDAAVNNLVEVADAGALQINLDECVDKFYEALYASFGAADSPSEQLKLAQYVPVLAITDNDGFYVQYKTTVNDEIKAVWSPKIPYSYSGTVTSSDLSSISYTVNFHLDDTVQILVAGSSIVYEGSYSMLREKYPAGNDAQSMAFYDVLSKSIIRTEESYVQWKREVITDSITRQLNYYVDQYNSVAGAYGISHTFSLPSGASSDLQNCVDSLSFIALFEGYPFRSGTDDSYSRFCVGGAQIVKTRHFYVCEASDGLLYYHTEGCNNIDLSEAFSYATKEEAASTGAIPCYDCNP